MEMKPWKSCEKHVTVGINRLGITLFDASKEVIRGVISRFHFIYLNSINIVAEKYQKYYEKYFSDDFCFKI